MVSFLCEKLFELVIVIVGVYVGYFLSNKQIRKQIKIETEMNQRTELAVHKNKFIFNSLIKFRDNLQEHNSYVTNFFLNSFKYSSDDFIRDPNLKNKLKRELDEDSRKIAQSYRKLENDLILLSKNFTEFKLENEFDIAISIYDTLEIAVYDHCFQEGDYGYLEDYLETRDLRINYSFTNVFTDKTAENLKRTAREIYEYQNDETKTFVKECSKKLQDNPHGFMSELYTEYYQNMFNLLDSVSSLIKKQFDELGK